MQSYNTSSPRDPIKGAGIDSKVSVGKGGKSMATVPADPVKVGKGGASKGFTGSLINPKVKC